MRKIFRNGRSDGWNNPKPYSDTSLRMMTHGKIHPMEEPSFLDRLLGRA
ncbi:hypothetical protein [Aurantiacibacter marinus]|nr:hypothetical protein [Aurantiacibacter marinus]